MIRLEEEIVIDRPVDRVFAFLASLENLPKWQSAVSSKVTTPGTVGVGTKFEESFKMLGRTVEAVCEITENEPQQRLGWKSTSSKMIAFESHFLFEPAEGGTKLRFAGWSALKGPWRLLEPFAGGEFRRELRGELEKLKRVIEAEP